MKTRKAIRQSFGLTQQEMAGLLGVSISTFSMYEIGQRQLPTHAMLVLLAMELHRESETAKAARKSRAQEAEIRNQTVLKKMLKDNELMQGKLQLKITAAKLRLDANERRNELSDFTTNHPVLDKAIALWPAGRPLMGPPRRNLTDFAAIVFEYETQLALLQLSEKFLSSQLSGIVD